MDTRKNSKSIVVEKLSKNFEVVRRGKNLKEKISSLLNPQREMIKALDKISFEVDCGELIGFIGPNGAGKTTTLKILSGLLYPTSGFVNVLGYDPWEKNEDYLRQLSLVMGQKNQLWWDLPAIDTYRLNKSIYKISDKDYSENLDLLLELLDVKKIVDIPVRKLSLGQRMRLELVASLLHKPKILFLDEPTIGLDVVAQARIREFIYDYNRKFKATIILTSHNMTDVFELARRIIVIDKGRIAFDGKIEKLYETYVKFRDINVFFAGDIDVKKIESIGKVKKLNFPQATIQVAKGAVSVAASELLQNFPISDLTIQEESLDDIVRRIFKSYK